MFVDWLVLKEGGKILIIINVIYAIAAAWSILIFT